MVFNGRQNVFGRKGVPPRFREGVVVQQSSIRGRMETHVCHQMRKARALPGTAVLICRGSRVVSFGRDVFVEVVRDTITRKWYNIYPGRRTSHSYQTMRESVAAACEWGEGASCG